GAVAQEHAGAERQQDQHDPDRAAHQHRPHHVLAGDFPQLGRPVGHELVERNRRRAHSASTSPRSAGARVASENRVRLARSSWSMIFTMLSNVASRSILITTTRSLLPLYGLKTCSRALTVVRAQGTVLPPRRQKARFSSSTKMLITFDSAISIFTFSSGGRL